MTIVCDTVAASDIWISDEVLIEMAQMKLICKIMMIFVRDQAKHHKMALSWILVLNDKHSLLVVQD